MTWFKRKPKCEHDWHDTGVRRRHYYGDISIHVYCPKCRANDIVAEGKWLIAEANKRIQAVYNR